jgi:hypothetical protein
MDDADHESVDPAESAEDRIRRLQAVVARLEAAEVNRLQAEVARLEGVEAARAAEEAEVKRLASVKKTEETEAKRLASAKRAEEAEAKRKTKEAKQQAKQEADRKTATNSADTLWKAVAELEAARESTVKDAHFVHIRRCEALLGGGGSSDKEAMEVDYGAMNVTMRAVLDELGRHVGAGKTWVWTIPQDKRATCLGQLNDHRAELLRMLIAWVVEVMCVRKLLPQPGYEKYAIVACVGTDADWLKLMQSTGFMKTFVATHVAPLVMGEDGYLDDGVAGDEAGHVSVAAVSTSVREDPPPPSAESERGDEGDMDMDMGANGGGPATESELPALFDGLSVGAKFAVQKNTTAKANSADVMKLWEAVKERCRSGCHEVPMVDRPDVHDDVALSVLWTETAQRLVESLLKMVKSVRDNDDNDMRAVVDKATKTGIAVDDLMKACKGMARVHMETWSGRVSDVDRESFDTEDVWIEWLPWRNRHECVTTAADALVTCLEEVWTDVRVEYGNIVVDGATDATDELKSKYVRGLATLRSALEAGEGWLRRSVSELEKYTRFFSDDGVFCAADEGSAHVSIQVKQGSMHGAWLGETALSPPLYTVRALPTREPVTAACNEATRANRAPVAVKFKRNMETLRAACKTAYEAGELGKAAIALGTVMSSGRKRDAFLTLFKRMHDQRERLTKAVTGLSTDAVVDPTSRGDAKRVEKSEKFVNKLKEVLALAKDVESMVQTLRDRATAMGVERDAVVDAAIGRLTTYDVVFKRRETVSAALDFVVTVVDADKLGPVWDEWKVEAQKAVALALGNDDVAWRVYVASDSTPAPLKLASTAAALVEQCVRSDRDRKARGKRAAEEDAVRTKRAKQAEKYKKLQEQLQEDDMVEYAAWLGSQAGQGTSAD